MPKPRALSINRISGELGSVPRFTTPAAAAPAAGDGGADARDGAHEHVHARRSTGQYALLVAGMCALAVAMFFKPSEPVLVDYVVQRHWQTNDALANNVIPYFSYSYAFWALVCGLCASATGFKLLIVLGCFANVAAACVWFFFGDNTLLLVFCQLLIGAYFSTLAMMQGYVLVMVARDRHAQITSFVRSSYLIGTVASSLLSQLLISLKLAGSSPPYGVLFYISIGAAVCALTGAAFLPTEPPQIERPQQSGGASPSTAAAPPPAPGTAQLLRASVRRLAAAAGDAQVVRLVLWSGWWLAVHTLVMTEWQNLFENETGAQANSLVLGVAYGSAALCALAQSATWVQRVLIYGLETALALAPLAAAGALYGMSRGSKSAPMPTYVSFVVYHSVFEFMQPFIIVHTSRRLTSDQFGVVFGAGTALALIFQVILQAILQAEPVLRHSAQDKFVFHAVLMLIMAVVSIAFSVAGCLCTSPAARPARRIDGPQEHESLLNGSGSSMSRPRYRIYSSSLEY